jgi:hypothetical protein
MLEAAAKRVGSGAGFSARSWRHPMRKFDSSNEGLSAMAELVDSASKKVAALLTFQHTNKKQCGDCFRDSSRISTRYSRNST